MNRRDFLTVLGSSTVPISAFSNKPVNQLDSPEDIYKRIFSIDAQCFSAAPPRTYVQHLTSDKINALRNSGITALAMNMTANYAELSLSESLFDAVRKRILTWDRVILENRDVFKKITTPSELNQVKRTGQVGLIFCFQMSAPFGWDLRKLETYIRMGVRQIQLVDGKRNYLVDSCWEKANAGLSNFGYEVISMMNDNGVIVDLSHVGEKSALDVISVSNKPVIFSHSAHIPEMSAIETLKRWVNGEASSVYIINRGGLQRTQPSQ